MRVAVFSDVHGNLAALEAVLAELDRLGPLDRVVCAGDVALFGPSPAEVIDLLRARGVETVRGNTDDWVLRAAGRAPSPGGEPAPYAVPEPSAQAAAHAAWCAAHLEPGHLDWLAALPLALRISPAPGGDLLVVHATPHTPHADVRLCAPGLPAAEARAAFGDAGARVVAFGHRHGGFVAAYEGLTLVNVSSVSIPPEHRPVAACVLLAWHGDHWSVELLRVPYDPAPELERARARALPRHPWWEALAAAG